MANVEEKRVDAYEQYKILTKLIVWTQPMLVSYNEYCVLCPRLFDGLELGTRELCEVDARDLGTKRVASERCLQGSGRLGCSITLKTAICGPYMRGKK